MKVLCEIAVRHVHLSQKDLEVLFGKGAKLEVDRMISQPGQYLAKQRVNLIGPKRTHENVAIIGPVRAETQVELARTDCFTLGIKDVPMRQSGNLKGTPGITLTSGENKVVLDHGVIVVQRHVHFDPKTAKAGGFVDGEIVLLNFEGERGAVLGNAVVRVHENFAPAVHIDSDEGNAVFFACGEITVQKK